MKLKSSQRIGLGPERGRDLFQVRQGHVGVGRPADGLEEPRGDRGEEVAATRRREERALLAGQRHQVLVGRLAVAERIGGERRGDVLGVGRGVEDEVDDRVGRRPLVVAEGVVEEVVEDLPVQLGLGAVVGEEPLGGAGPVFPDARGRVAEADRQGALLFEVAGHLVGLAVEHHLEAVLDAAEESIRVLHDPALLGGQAADVFEAGHRDEGVGVADLGILAAVEELEELDDELDVADAAAAGLDLDLGVPLLERSAPRSAASSP